LKLIESLEKRGYTNIFIIDNDSKYPPLVKYYETCPYKVFRLDRNVGHLALWKTGLYKQFINDYYVYTDPDVVPVEECPENFLETFHEALKKHRMAKKIGFSLKIDDLPESFNRKAEVIKWETEINKGESYDEILYRAQVDTTFALYRPLARNGANPYHLTFRTKYPYCARHLPWYIDSSNLSDEDFFYIQNATTSTHWTVMNK
jgi:hypothetical protein